ncbi:DUF1501 domain-containing protein [Roseateles sp. BYS180W]|uniref:DUF1501 domain-containing protein n=1 Tax=Roseateles rivi TaxID=3299028 RepID=A0ABW7FUB2_9BURK
MHINRLPRLQRREFLRRASALGLAGSAAPWALSLAGIGEAAAAATAPGDYKALVCVFLYGGNDHGNTLLPYDPDNYQRYATLRQTLATPREALSATALSSSQNLGGRQMALAPQLGQLKALWDQGRLGIQLNVGTLVQPTTLAQYQAQSVPLPPKLFSHNDQQSVWQSSAAEGATTGWGGRMGDLFLSGNGAATFTCINVSGNAVFMSGQQAVQYQVSTSGAVPVNAVTRPLFGSQACADALRELITAPREHWMEAELNRVVKRSIGAQSTVSTALDALPPLGTPFDSSNKLAEQLAMVAKLIAARQALGATRQVFFVSLGGFDLHDFLLAQHPGLLTSVNDALASFYAATVELGVAQQVTTFTASDFGRTLSSNGDGSDHGWGSHHFVLGGAVKGGQYWGQLPAVAVNGPDDVGQGRLLPSTSVDQLAATLARWMGVPATELPRVLPHIVNYSQQDMGYF